jgi:predicted 2-oxoglutarate/Fe(II)-dependent dioxygenase YbiX/peroxiredoxin
MSENPAAPRKGDHAPWFRAPALGGASNYNFSIVAGRHVLMLFFGSAGAARTAECLRLVERERDLFDDERACFFGVTIDPSDASKGRIAQQLPGIRFFLDYEAKLSGIYGAASGDKYSPRWLVLDPTLRILDIFPADAGEQAIECLSAAVAGTVDEGWAPVLLVRDVLEPDLCRRLIATYEADGGEESGFMRDVDGKTVLIVDHGHKRRRDCALDDEAVRREIRESMVRRLNPALLRFFQFQATRMERYIIACYEPGAGHFRPHRDNTTKGTAHRKFAVTINLNAGDYEGGDLHFPEFGARTYRAPTGGAIVFSCSMLHEATPVTKGRRFAFLPFLYDEAGARIREANSHFLAEGGGEYRADQEAMD